MSKKETSPDLQRNVNVTVNEHWSAEPQEKDDYHLNIKIKHKVAVGKPAQPLKSTPIERREWLIDILLTGVVQVVGELETSSEAKLRALSHFFARYMHEGAREYGFPVLETLELSREHAHASGDCDTCDLNDICNPEHRVPKDQLN